MNFFAHATIALRQSSDAGFVLGAMLPDLFNMLGVRLREVDDAEISAGIAFHHATDAAFHGAPEFNALCGQALAALERDAVGRGTARAVSHVGIELLLDGALSHDAHAREVYLRALTSPTHARIVRALGPESANEAERLHAGLQRLAKAPIPEGYREPDFVFDRLQTMLARRPRLAIAPSDVPAVRRLLHATKPEVERARSILLDQVHARLT